MDWQKEIESLVGCTQVEIVKITETLEDRLPELEQGLYYLWRDKDDDSRVQYLKLKPIRGCE